MSPKLEPSSYLCRCHAGQVFRLKEAPAPVTSVILFDEIDKMSSDFRGDPASAMLEVLDPEQNRCFSDHYIELEYDLSKVMFIMTANDLSNVPAPYEIEWRSSRCQVTLPMKSCRLGRGTWSKKAVKNNGLHDYEMNISDVTLMHIIRDYSKESGVRELERLLNTIARKIATEIVTENIPKGEKFIVAPKHLKKYLGPQKFDRTDVEREPQVGLVNGLAWTAVGGELLNIEVVTVPGKWQDSDYRKIGRGYAGVGESALSYVRSISSRLGIDPTWYDKNDIHIHVPEGATPKDGPSAGVTMVTALASAVTGIKVFQDVAMTGEVTIRGRVLPIGGLKEKMLAAKQAGIKTVIIPSKNEKDLSEIPNDIKMGLKIVPCEMVEEVLRHALNLSQPDSFMKVVGLKVLGPEDTTLEVAN